ncbi:hypothetical protein ABIA33_001407 [Streptacidiphilus sp. MAP12-16]|uniref:hypothetical protein n=1 Tax=Streptacidiphilus sp. MAP12-16 TaxID=3156300 RepID=UPI003510FF0E
MDTTPEPLDLRTCAVMPADVAEVIALRVDPAHGMAFTALPHPANRPLPPGRVGITWTPAPHGTAVLIRLGGRCGPQRVTEDTHPGDWVEQVRPTVARALQLAARAPELAIADPDPTPTGELAPLLAAGHLHPGDLLTGRTGDGTLHLALVTASGQMLLPDGTLHHGPDQALAHTLATET